MGDTEISLHIRPGATSNFWCGEGVFSWRGGGFSWSQKSKSSKCQDLPKFELGGGAYSPEVKTQNLLGAKICLYLNRGGGYSPEVKTQNLLSAKIYLYLNLGGGGFSWSQNSKYQVLAKFSFSGGGGGKLGTKSQNRVSWDFLTKFSITPASYCITVISHILRMWRLIKSCLNVLKCPKMQKSLTAWDSPSSTRWMLILLHSLWWRNTHVHIPTFLSHQITNVSCHWKPGWVNNIMV